MSNVIFYWSKIISLRKHFILSKNILYPIYSSMSIIIRFCIENTYNNLLESDYSINIINPLSIVEMNLYYGGILLDYIIWTLAWQANCYNNIR